MNKNKKKWPKAKPATTMKMVAEPVCGKFYAIDYIWETTQPQIIELYSGRLGPRHGAPEVLVDMPAGSMVFYLGKHSVPGLGYAQEKYYKLGYGEFFGFVRVASVNFYELGE